MTVCYCLTTLRVMQRTRMAGECSAMNTLAWKDERGGYENSRYEEKAIDQGARAPTNIMLIEPAKARLIFKGYFYQEYRLSHLQ
jgi:hypothetical protein